MDLAKIRKKSLSEKPGEGAVTLPAVAPHPHAVELCEMPGQNVLIADMVDMDVQMFPWLSSLSLHSSPETSEPRADVTGFSRGASAQSPLEIILAGRESAGCHELSILTDEVLEVAVTVSHLEYLSFRVSNEVYGVNIMDIKEIIKARAVTEVPRSPEFIAGILSLRGTIIPVIDMRYRLGLSSGEVTGKERIVVIKNNNSLCGLLVDEVMKVVQIAADAVEAAPVVIDGIDRDFISWCCSWCW